MSEGRRNNVHLQIREVDRAMVMLNAIGAARRTYLNRLQRLGTPAPRDAAGVDALFNALTRLRQQRDRLTARLASVT